MACRQQRRDITRVSSMSEALSRMERCIGAGARERRRQPPWLAMICFATWVTWLLAMAKPKETARYAVFYCADELEQHHS